MESDGPSESPVEEAVNRESIEDRISVEHDSDTDHKPSSKKADLESRISVDEAGKRQEKSEKVDTLDGSIVIVYYIDKATGQVYLAFESKTETYPIHEARGKLALFGGTIRLGESSPETLSRELKEEDPDSYKILIKALKDNGRKVDEIRERVDGTPSWTSIYATEIEDPREWREYGSTTPTEGYKRILTLEETLLAISKNAFGFPSQGKAVYNFIKKEFGTYLRKVA